MALNADSLSLDALFGYADIDDVTEEDDRVVLVFTIRGDSDGPQQVSGEDIYDCLDQAATIIRRDRTLSEIRRHGLTDEDVDRLADADDSWKRGYAAGAEDAVEALVSASIRAQAEPAMAMAGEACLRCWSARVRSKIWFWAMASPSPSPSFIPPRSSSRRRTCAW
jgi:hypothetical protein